MNFTNPARFAHFPTNLLSKSCHRVLAYLDFAPPSFGRIERLKPSEGGSNTNREQAIRDALEFMRASEEIDEFCRLNPQADCPLPPFPKGDAWKEFIPDGWCDSPAADPGEDDLYTELPSGEWRES